MVNLVIYLYFNIIDMDNKVKSSVLILLFLVFLILSLNRNLAFNTVLIISLTTIFYNIKKGVSVYLLLGITGIYLSSVLKSKLEGFQGTSSSTVVTLPTTSAEIVNQASDFEKKQTMSLTLKNLKELNLLLDSVLRVRSNDIDKTLRENNINDIFKLREYIKFYKNQPDSDIDTNSPFHGEKAESLSEYIPVYLIDPGLKVTLINREGVSVNDLKNSVELRNRIFGVDSYNILGLKYYFGEKKLNKKHYKIIKTLELDNNLPEKVAENMEALLISDEYNSYIIKDIIGIVILFEHYGFLGTESELNNSWASDDLGGDKWVIKTLSQIDITSPNSFLKTNSLFRDYNLVSKIDNYLKNRETERQDRIKQETIDFSKPLSTVEKGQLVKEAVNNIKPAEITEYHKYLTEQLENIREKDNTNNNILLEFNDIDSLLKKSNTTLTDVVDETRVLIQNLNNDTDNSNSAVNNFANKYLLFTKEFMNIITRDQRMLFVGLFIMILAVVFSFIEINL
jgi:hypothetical protein